MTGSRRASPTARVRVDYFESGASQYAAGLGFNLLLAIFPLVLGLFAQVGLVARRGSFYE